MDKSRLPLTILHIGWGFRPFRGGGLIEYAEDLMESQVERGHRVAYFFAGRRNVLGWPPILRQWERKGVRMFEIFNSPIIHGGDQGSYRPWLDLHEPASERLFIRVLDKIRPDIIHIQEFAGLPTSIIEIAHQRDLPMVMTLHDYFLLCPTLKLFDSDEKNCLDEKVGTRCVVCCQQAPDRNLPIAGSFKYFTYKGLRFVEKVLSLFQLQRYISGSTWSSIVRRVKVFDPGMAEKFQQRREINLKRFRMINKLIAISSKVASLYRHFLGEDVNLITLHLTLKHFETIRPKVMHRVVFPIRFTVLNGCASVAKGGKLIRDVAYLLKDRSLDKDCRLLIYGPLHPDLEGEWLEMEHVEYRGTYRVEDLDVILNDVDVGIIPSVWEEAYGYVGIEFLAKGIPIIGNRRGGIPDYTLEGLTGWLNHENSAEGMVRIMEEIIRQSDRIIKLNRRIIENRDRFIKPMARHVEEMDRIYQEVIEQHSR